MVLSIMVPHFPAIGSGVVPPVPPTILMSDQQLTKPPVQRITQPPILLFIQWSPITQSLASQHFT